MKAELVYRADREEQQHDAETEPEVAEAVDDEGLLARVRGGFLFVLIADQEVRAEADRLPAEVELQEVVRHDEHEHREGKEAQI